MGTYNRKDHFYQRAKDEGYRSRAAYKLAELNNKFHLLKQGQRILDLGCAPGSWLQVAAQKVGPSGAVVGVDLLALEPFKDSELKALGSKSKPIIIQGDACDEEIQSQIREAADGLFDVVLSDMSPQISGIRFRDAAMSAELVETALYISQALLKPGGSLVAKIFPGNEADEVVNEIRKHFGKVSRIGLSSTRKSSKEFYIVATSARPK
jgi:23S rRNA (uridine2552-2'-O)-methyltransferase